MSAREYLSETFRMRSRMIALKRREEELRTEAEGLRAIVYDKDKVQTSVTNKFDAIMADLISVQLEYGSALEECMREIAIREKRISFLPMPYADVLRRTYLEDDRWPTLKVVAKRIGYSYDRTKHLHREALAIFDTRYKC